MKKALAFLSLAVLALSSCQTMVKTARTADTQSDIKSITVADLKVADQRVTATIDPVGKDLRKAGDKNVKQAVEAKALEMAGGADVLLDPRYVITQKSGLFTGKKITSITVSGRPAWYQNFRTLDDSVWSNPTFRGIAPVYVRKSGSSRSNILGASSFREEKEPVFRHRGFKGYMDFYFGGGQAEIDNHDEDVSFAPMITASYGYQFGPYFYLGFFTGFQMNKIKDWDTPYNFVPVGYDMRFNLSRSANTWYAGLKFGAAIPTNHDTNVDKTEDQILVIPSLGYSWGNFNLGIYYMHNEYERKYRRYSRGASKADFKFDTWGINVGLRL